MSWRPDWRSQILIRSLWRTVRLLIRLRVRLLIKLFNMSSFRKRVCAKFSEFPQHWRQEREENKTEINHLDAPMKHVWDNSPTRLEENSVLFDSFVYLLIIDRSGVFILVCQTAGSFWARFFVSISWGSDQDAFRDHRETRASSSTVISTVSTSLLWQKSSRKYRFLMLNFNIKT